MKLLACHVDNFGKLSDFDYVFSDGLNEILEENGFGKSTLAVFIKVMLYGFENKKDKDALDKERKLYEPWQGGSYGGQLDFAANGKTYRIVRCFGKTEKNDVFQLFDLGTHVESKDFSEHVGEELFDLDGNSFQRSIYIAQSEVLVDSSDQMHAKLGNLSEQTNDIENFEAAMVCLKNAMNRLTPDRATGSLKKRKSQITELQESYKRFQSAEEGYFALSQKLEEQCKHKANLEGQRLTMQKELRLASQADCNQLVRDTLKDYEEDVIRHRAEIKREYKEFLMNERLRCLHAEDIVAQLTRAKEIEELKQKKETLGYKLDVKSQYLEQRRSRMGKTAVLVELLLGLAAFYFRQSFAYWKEGLVICGILLIITFFLQGKKGRYKNTEEEELSFLDQEIKEREMAVHAFLQHLAMDCDTSEFVSKLYELQNLCEKYKLAIASTMEAEKRLQDYQKEHKSLNQSTENRGEHAFSLEEYQAKIDQLEREIEDAKEAIVGYNRSIENLKDQMDQRDETRLLLDQALELQEVETKQYEIYRLTSDYLQAAKEGFNAKYMGPVQKGFEKYFSCIAAEGTGDFLLDANMKLMRKEEGAYRDARWFSEGMKDTMGLCMRFALVDAMFEGEKPFLILDDPFVNFDEEKLESAKKVVKELSREYQIVYFTCHSSRMA